MKPLLQRFASWLFLPIEEPPLKTRLTVGAVTRATSTRWWKPTEELFTDSRFLYAPKRDKRDDESKRSD